MDIFKLTGSIFVDTNQANESLQKTDEKTEQTGKKMETMGEKVSKAAFSFNNIVSMGKTVVSALGSIYNSAKQTIEDLDDIQKSSIRMGTSAEYYQELAHVATLCGIEMSTMEKAAKKLEGTGVTLENALDEIMALETEEERTAKASEYFGDSIAYTLSPLLQNGAESFDDMRKEAYDLGIVMSQDVVDAAADTNDKLTKVQEIVDGLKTQLLVEFLPYLEAGCQWLIDNIPKILDAARDLFNDPVLKETIADMSQQCKDLLDFARDAYRWIEKIAGGPHHAGSFGEPTGEETEYNGTGDLAADVAIMRAANASYFGETLATASATVTKRYAVSGAPVGDDARAIYEQTNAELANLSNAINKLGNMRVVLDSGVLVGQMNSKMASIKTAQSRGNSR